MLPIAKTKWLALGLGLAMISAASLASEIYRWTDEEGNVHYGDRPTGVADEERLAIKSRPTDDAAVQQRYDDRYASATTEARRAAAEEAKADAEPPPTRAERKAAAAERQAECERLSAQLESMGGRRRMYREDENGERTYMTDDEVVAFRDNLAARVAETCD
jgi:hypothetical protein